ncbi:MAG: FG-GAP-like repeat-containing protein [Reichenbachiella sp.]|uniref:FG-GAP-like repeat-containing protein n=3 Tax=Reichenbachiella sp. TaxID=2184521 RepID=UPI003264E3FC
MKLSCVFHRKSNIQPRNISDKNPTTTIRIYLSVMFWLACLPLCAQVPTITSFSPSSGPVGTSVIISGTNFDPTLANNTVFFGATEATVTAATADQLTVPVPTGATYAPITVLVNGLTGYSSDPFVVTFSNPTISTASYAPLEEHTTGSSPRGIAVGDLNNDGKPDLVVANGSSSTVSIFKNTSTNGAVSYDPKVDLTAGTTPQDVAVSDLDGDGRLDLVVANQSDHTISIYRNTGTGSTISFADKVDFTAGTNPYAVAIGDIDGDGKPELITANRLSDDVTVLRNTSTIGAIDVTSFASKVDFPVGSSPYDVVLGDLDGDGKVDIAVANRSDNTISTLRNTSTNGIIDASSFAAKVDRSTGLSPYALALGDLDGDGKADLAVANRSQGTVSVLRNASSGIGVISYGRIDYYSGTSAIAVAIGDLDGDSKPDLAVVSQTGRLVSVFKNTSTPGTIDANSFADKVDYDPGYYIYALVLGDQDGDHKPDMVVTNQIGHTISVLRHTGSDTATDITAFSFTEQTGDALIDAAAHTIDIEVEFGTDLTALISTFTLSPGATAKVGGTSQVSATTTNDFTNPVVYGITAGDGMTTQDWTITATTESPSTETDIVEFTLAEQTKEATIDAITHTVNLEVFSGTNITALVPTFSLSTVVTAAKVGAVKQISGITPNDFTNQVTYTITAEDDMTTQDWVVTLTEAAPIVTISSFAPISGPVGTSVVITGENFDSTPANNVVYFGGAKAEVTAVSASELTVTVPIGATYQPITVLTNGLIAESSAPFELTFTAADINAHSFATHVDIVADSELSEVMLGDLDGDGQLDLAFANGTGSAVSASIMKNASSIGNVSYEPKVELTTGSSQVSMSLGDLDGDGKLDLAIVDFPNNVVSIFRNTSVSGILEAGSFADKVDITTGSGPVSVAIGDLDGDGKLDLAVTNRSGNSVSVFENRCSAGTISFAEKVDYVTGASAFSVSIQDLDDDNRPELVVANRAHHNVSIYKNTSTVGTISYADRVSFDVGTNPEHAAIGDLDGDDKPDLIIANNGGSKISVLRNTTTSGTIDATSFATKVNFTTGTSPRSVAIGDLDGNGKQDIAVANGDDSTISVFMNTSTEGVIDANSFADKVDFDTEDSPFFVAIGDLDGDGKNDLVSGNSFSTSLLRHNRADTEITAFSLPGQTSAAVIDSDNHTIVVEVEYTPDVSALIPTFTLSSGATAKVSSTTQVSGTTANDFSDPVIYTVTAEDNTTAQDWAITVTLAPNTETDMTSFGLSGHSGTSVLDASAHTVGLEVPFGTDVSSLVATFVLSSGATAHVNSVAQVSDVTFNDFTSPVVYNIIAEDGATAQDWTVTVTIKPPGVETDITAFSIPEQIGAAAIDDVHHTIGLEVPFGTNVSSLVPTFTLSTGATAKINSTTQVSGTTSNDFTSSVTYSVIAEDGTTNQDWTVSVTLVPNTATDITAFSIPQQTETAIIDAINHTVNIEVPFGTDVSSLVATFMASSGATTQMNSIMQVSGSTSNDFTDPVIYTVTAEDGSTTQDWEVVVKDKPNGVPTVSPATFTIDENASVDEFVGQVTATDPDDDDLTFSIESGNEGNVFQIGQNTGRLSVVSPLDFETTPEFSLVVEVEDGKGGTSSAIITVSLNDVDEVSVLAISDAIRTVDIYPNPVSSLLTIQWHKFDQAIFRDFSGREVLRSLQRVVDLKDLRTGIYILTLESKSNEQVSFRVIKK